MDPKSVILGTLGNMRASVEWENLTRAAQRSVVTWRGLTQHSFSLIKWGGEKFMGLVLTTEIMHSIKQM